MRTRKQQEYAVLFKMRSFIISVWWKDMLNMCWEMRNAYKLVIWGERQAQTKGHHNT
jgi:hypothetical protein